MAKKSQLRLVPAEPGSTLWLLTLNYSLRDQDVDQLSKKNEERLKNQTYVLLRSNPGVNGALTRSNTMFIDPYDDGYFIPLTEAFELKLPFTHNDWDNVGSNKVERFYTWKDFIDSDTGQLKSTFPLRSNSLMPMDEILVQITPNGTINNKYTIDPDTGARVYTGNLYPAGLLLDIYDKIEKEYPNNNYKILEIDGNRLGYYNELSNWLNTTSGRLQTTQTQLDIINNLLDWLDYQNFKSLSPEQLAEYINLRKAEYLRSLTGPYLTLSNPNNITTEEMDKNSAKANQFYNSFFGFGWSPGIDRIKTMSDNYIALKNIGVKDIDNPYYHYRPNSLEYIGGADVISKGLQDAAIGVATYPILGFVGKTLKPLRALLPRGFLSRIGNILNINQKFIPNAQILNKAAVQTTPFIPFAFAEAASATNQQEQERRMLLNSPEQLASIANDYINMSPEQLKLEQERLTKELIELTKDLTGRLYEVIETPGDRDTTYVALRMRLKDINDKASPSFWNEFWNYAPLGTMANAGYDYAHWYFYNRPFNKYTKYAKNLGFFDESMKVGSETPVYNENGLIVNEPHYIYQVTKNNNGKPLYTLNVQTNIDDFWARAKPHRLPLNLTIPRKLKQFFKNISNKRIGRYGAGIVLDALRGWNNYNKTQELNDLNNKLELMTRIATIAAMRGKPFINTLDFSFPDVSTTGNEYYENKIRPLLNEQRPEFSRSDTNAVNLGMYGNISNFGDTLNLYKYMPWLTYPYGSAQPQTSESESESELDTIQQLLYIEQDTTPNYGSGTFGTKL